MVLDNFWGLVFLLDISLVCLKILSAPSTIYISFQNGKLSTETTNPTHLKIPQILCLSLCLANHSIKTNSRYNFINPKITLRPLSPTCFLYSLLCIFICLLSVPDKIILKQNTALILSWNKVQAFQCLSPNQRILLSFHDYTIDTEDTYSKDELRPFQSSFSSSISMAVRQTKSFSLYRFSQNSIHFTTRLKSV